MARLNRPQPQGEIHKAIGTEWTLYSLGQDRYKLCSNAPVEGNANYSLVIKRGHIERTADQHKLKSARPFLYDDIERAMGTLESLSENDPYGDIAVASGKPLTAEQMWKRKLVYMRQCYLDLHFATWADKPEYDIERALNALYPPIFGDKPPRQALEQAREAVYRGDFPNRDAYIGVLRDYYEGRYRPKSCETFMLHLDIICGVL